ncbi:MAG: hypothetical protein NTW10_08260 [Bacteroidetes bacterium]|nr:hypothetical protein [Bacteroidota bacterium]
MKLFRITFFLSIVIAFGGCNWQKNRLQVDVSGVGVPDVRIHRYDVDLFKVPVSNLKNGLEQIQNSYYFFLGTDLGDPKKLDEMRAYLENPRTIDFQKASEIRFKDLSKVEKDLTDAFRHWKYYYPDIRIPRVYSYISGGDYSSPVQLVDSVMIIGLDNYLGKDFKPYLSDQLALYKAERMTEDHIVPDCAREIVNAMYPETVAPNTLLGGMVEAGKRQYFVDALIPDIPGYLKLDYTKAQYTWAEKNETHVWAALVENQMLYSTDGQYFRMFLADGPYTMEFSKDSPPRLGEWIGLQIIRSYMQKNPEVTLQMMMQETDAQKILTLSGYKPEK